MSKSNITKQLIATRCNVKQKLDALKSSQLELEQNLEKQYKPLSNILSQAINKREQSFQFKSSPQTKSTNIKFSTISCFTVITGHNFKPSVESTFSYHPEENDYVYNPENTAEFNESGSETLLTQIPES